LGLPSKKLLIAVQARFHGAIRRDAEEVLDRLPPGLERGEEDLDYAVKHLDKALDNATQDRDDAADQVLEAVQNLLARRLAVRPVEDAEDHLDNADDDVGKSLDDLDDAREGPDDDDDDARQHLANSLDDIDQLAGDELGQRRADLLQDLHHVLQALNLDAHLTERIAERVQRRLDVLHELLGRVLDGLPDVI
jgi:chromosome segregation ATPase